MPNKSLKYIDLLDERLIRRESQALDYYVNFSMGYMIAIYSFCNKLCNTSFLEISATCCTRIVTFRSKATDTWLSHVRI